MENNQNTSEKKPKKPIGIRILKVFAKIILGLIIFFLLLVLFIRSPWGQGIIVDKAVSYIADKTNTKVEIEKMFITFDGDLQLEGVYLEDKAGDTLIYSKSLEANVPLWGMINGTAMGVDDLQWEGVRTNFIRKDTINGFNFQFLADAFAPTDTTTVAVDSTSASPELVIGDLDLKDFDVLFNDAVSGIKSRYIFDELIADMKSVDMETMKFSANELTLTNARIDIDQSTVPDNPDEEEPPLPFIASDEVRFQNVFFRFDSQPEQLALEFDVSELYTELKAIDLTSSTFNIGEFDLRNSIVLVRTETESQTTPTPVEETDNSQSIDNSAFTWPEINLTVNSIDLVDDKFSFFVGNDKVEKSVFNPNAVVLTNLNLDGSNLKIGDQEANVSIDSATFSEGSGFDVNQLAISFQLNEKQLNANDIQLAINGNRLSGRLNMKYPSLNAMISSPETATIDFNFPSFRFDIGEVFKFQPDLRNNPYLKTLAQRNLTGSLAASGVLSNMKIPNANVQWGPTTSISTSGSIKNATVPDSLRFDLPSFNAVTTRSDLEKFIPQDSLTISLPKEINLSGSLAGSTTNMDADAVLTTSQGLARLDGNFEFRDRIVFDGNLSIEEYRLNELLNNEQLGSLSLNLKATGQGKDLNSLNAQVDATISNFSFNNYQIKDLNINGDIVEGIGTVNSKYKDENLNMTLASTIVLDSVAPEANLELDIIGASLQSLGISSRDIRTGMTIYADFKGNLENYDASAIIEDGVVVYDEKSYLLGNFSTLAHVRKDTTSLSLRNKLIDLDLQSNVEPQVFSKAIQDHVFSYFYRDIALADTIQNPVNVKLEGHIAQAPILDEVFFVNLKDIDTVDISMDFNQKKRQLTAKISAPHINYSSIEIDSLNLFVDTDQDRFDFDLNFNQINAGPLSIQSTSLHGDQVDNVLDLDFNAYHDDFQLIHIGAEVSGNRDDLRLHIKPDSLILNNKKWNTPQDNEMRYLVDRLEFSNFNFDQNNQSVQIISDKPGYDKDHMAIMFENFKLSEFLNYLNPDETLATGILNGDLTLEKPLTDTGILADLTVRELSFLDVDMGTLQMNGNSLGGNSYAFNLGVSGGEVDLDLVGDYTAENNQALIDLDLRLNEVKMSAMDGFSLGYLEEGSGSFSGGFKLNGTLLEPEYSGSLKFDNANFTVAALNADFTLPNETLSINNEGIEMDNFRILDTNDNELLISGSVGTESFINPTFDLTLKAENFEALNATEEDNDFIYGIATFNADATIKGDLQIPIINGNAEILPDTNITYVLPTATVNLEERDGIVVFVNKENPDAILTKSEEKVATVKGFDISTFFTVDDEAILNILIDQETGDNFQVSGDGEFKFTMQPSGRMSLTGVYDISGGHYEMNLYSLVNRKFLLADGGKIRWSGDPFDAELDITAIYEIETSASSLMAPRISGADPSVKNRYKQVLPFYVYLNVDGALMSPKISFDLDMPEDEQGAIGGEVYGRIQEVNQQEGELNRQVFSLLVLNKFYPEVGSDGSRGGFASIARDNLNDALADQLNVFSDKLLGNSGVELDFNLDTFTDYQGENPQERTQLDIAAQKKLFNDRFTVRVGSEVDVQGSSPTGEGTPLIGNVSLEYELTSDGRYRLKGFRRNEFENIIDGQTIVSGIALIFTQEFNKFSELWDALLKSKTEEEKSNEEEIKETQEKMEQKDEQQKAEQKKNE